MAKNYDKLFKFEHSNNDIYHYIVYRKNLFNKFKEVAKVKLLPGECANIIFSKNVSLLEEQYIEEYFMTLVNLKFERSPDNMYYYTVYRKTSTGEFEIVALVDSSITAITSIKILSPHECLYISSYFKALANS